MNASKPWNLHRPVDRSTDDSEADAADLGTAFGMECSLAAQEPKPAASTAASSATAPDDPR
jgi:hypothetical protein